MMYCCVVSIHGQGSFWGAILWDSRIFFSKIALILLQCENSRNIDVEATGYELDSLRVDFVLFQWNLCHDSVWVNDTFAFLIHFSELTQDRLRASSSLCLQRKNPKSSVSGALTAEFYQSSSATSVAPTATPRRKNGRHLQGLVSIETVKVASSQHCFYIDVHKVCGKLGQGKICIGWWYTLIFSMNMD